MSGKRPANRRPPAARAGEVIGTGHALWWCAVSGALVFLSFPFRPLPESGLWPLTWIALVPLLMVLPGVSARRAFWYGMVTGVVTNFGGFWWIEGVLREFGHLPEALSWGLSGLNATYQGLQYALFAWILVRVSDPQRGPTVLRTAAVFTAVEFLFPMIFPWYLGNSQYRAPVMIQLAELTGPAGVTFLVVAANVLALRLLDVARGRPRRARELAIGALIVVGAAVWGLVRIAQVDAAIAEAPSVKVGLVEADVGIWEKEARGMAPRQRALTLHRNLLLHQELTARLQAGGADLVVWPESSFFPWGDVFIKRSEVFAVGVTEAGQLLHWLDQGDAGFQWSLANAGGGALHDVVALREDAAAAVGDGGRVLLGDVNALSVVPALEPDPARRALRAVDLAPVPGHGHDDDGAPVRLWAAGDGGLLITGGAEGYRIVPVERPVNLRSVTMLSDGHGWAVGDGGAVVSIVRGVARMDSAGVSSDLYAATVDRRRRRAIVAGAEGRVYRSGRDGWSEEPTGTQKALRDLAWFEGSLWAAGDGGLVMRRDERGTWTKVPFPEDADLRAISFDARGDLLVSGAHGGLWRRGRGQPQWRRVAVSGLAPVTGLASVPYTRTRPLPRDVRYVYQSQAPLVDPEAFLADPTDELTRPLRDRTAVQRGFDVPVIFGGITWEEGGSSRDGLARYNTAVMLDGAGRVVGTYDKNYLLVFGEYLPFGDWFPVLYEWIPESGGFRAGHDVQVFQWGERRVGVMICYEDLLPRFTRALAARDPNLIVNVTNDAWFGQTAEPYLHLALSTFRSVELRRSFVRATNTGVSALMDPVGRILEKTSLEGAEVAMVNLPLLDSPTIYGTVGDGFAYLNLLFVGGWLLWRRRSPSSSRSRKRAK